MGTKRVYLSALTAYMEFTSLTPEELVGEAEKGSMTIKA
jgi:hypothetical protein